MAGTTDFPARNPGDTKQFSLVAQGNDIKNILLLTYDALKEKGYDPINQIVGYILTEDPTYITTHNNARNQIRRIDRFELLQILLTEYIKPDKNN